MSTTTVIQWGAERPSVNFCLKLLTPAWNAKLKADGEKKFASIKPEATAFKATVQKLEAALKTEEALRPLYSYDLTLDTEKTELTKALATEDSRYAQSLRQYEEKLSALRTQLAAASDDITVGIGIAELKIESGIAGQLAVDLAVTEKNTDLEEAREDEGCCASCFPCCCGGSKVKKNEKEIAALEQKQTFLRSKERSDAKASAATTAALISKRSELRDAEQKLLTTKPESKRAPIELRLAKVQAQIENGKELHETGLSNSTMLLVIIAYHQYLALESKINTIETPSTTSKPADEKTTLLSTAPKPPRTLKTIFNDVHTPITELFNKFWCPHSNSQRADAIYYQFKLLNEAEQKAILSFDAKGAQGAIQRILPLGELQSDIITYHPKEPDYPDNCPAKPRLMAAPLPADAPPPPANGQLARLRQG